MNAERVFVTACGAVILAACAIGKPMPKVHQIRTGGLTDSHHSRLFGVSVATVRDARIGKTWTDHPFGVLSFSVQ